MQPDADARQVIERYKHLLESKQDSGEFSFPLMSQEYGIFREEALEKSVTFYERMCVAFGNFLHVRVAPDEHRKLQESITTAHLDVTPDQAIGFGTLLAVLLLAAGLVLGGASYAFGVLGDYVFVMFLFMVGGVLLIKPLTRLPLYFAQRWRLAASNQMVLCILYLVIYMRHTSNLEHAIKFAGEHIGMPLSLDFKKVLWDVETGNFVTIKESLEHYLAGWKTYNLEFVEAMHLIEGSLFETQETKRIDTLEKALQVILDGTYERMLHYAHNLKSPITILHMLGVILPILGLVIFPLVGSFLGGLVKWYHLAFLYNLLLPLLVFFLGTQLLSARPTGYGHSTSSAFRSPSTQMDKQPGASPAFWGLVVGGVVVLFSFLPFFLHWVAPHYDAEFLGQSFLDYKDGAGPYGFWALIISLLLPLGLAAGFGLYFLLKTKKNLEFTKRTDLLEKDFSGGLFQLGNRIGSGVPAEQAFGNVARTLQGTPTGDLFQLIDTNIRSGGMSIKQAIFDSKTGAILYYPSSLIQSTMKVLVESAKKGPAIASRSLITISQYTDRIKQVNERLKDLMADVLSSMTSQITFLTPIIAGIVVGVGSMVVTIINILSEQFKTVGLEEGGFTGGVGALASILNITDVIPGYQFQAVVGIYVVELTILLTLLGTSIERGVDDVTSQYRIGKNLFTSVGLYVVISLVGVVLFNLLAGAVGAVGR